METLLKNGAEVYAVVYFGAIGMVALLEAIRPRYAMGPGLGTRWFGNFGLTIIGAVIVRMLFPVAGVGWALLCADRGLGLFNQVTWPSWVELALTVLLLDASVYAQHVLLHKIPVLWRMHRTHHSDHDFDFSTGVRFHPFETLYSTCILMGMILALGAPPVAVLVAQILFVTSAFVEHANLRIAPAFDRELRVVIVTPDMHRIHHSQELREGESNFSNLFSFWDRLFGTYVDQPAAGHDGIVFGVAEFSDRRRMTLPWLLVQPFLRGNKSAEASSLELLDRGPETAHCGLQMPMVHQAHLHAGNEERART
jgi:sterol desaturase/sphingolipid hydroxylase (fatty acid hydroxylase superfamily)